MTTKQTDEQTKTVEEIRAELEAVENEIDRTEADILKITADGDMSAKGLDTLGRARNRLEMLGSRATALRGTVLETEADELDAAAVEARAECGRLNEEVEEARAKAEPWLRENFAFYPEVEVSIRDLIEAYKPVHSLVLEQRAAWQRHTVAAKLARGFRRENGV